MIKTNLDPFSPFNANAKSSQIFSVYTLLFYLYYRVINNRILMSRGQYDNAEVNALWFNKKQRRRVQNHLLGLFKRSNIKSTHEQIKV